MIKCFCLSLSSEAVRSCGDVTFELKHAEARRPYQHFRNVIFFHFCVSYIYVYVCNLDSSSYIINTIYIYLTFTKNFIVFVLNIVLLLLCKNQMIHTTFILKQIKLYERILSLQLFHCLLHISWISSMSI
jgi:hypothetical protein